MLLDISEIIRVVGSSFRFELNETDLDLGELTVISPVTGEITVSNSGARLLIRGTAWADVLLPCSRCLKEFPYTLQADIEEDFDMQVIKRRASRKRVDDQGVQALFAGAAIDLAELIHQEFTLSLPINAVCSTDCTVAADTIVKADTDAQLKQDGSIDPRWQVLVDEMHRRSDQ